MGTSSPARHRLVALVPLSLAASLGAGCGSRPAMQPPPTQASSKIEHVVILVQENHTFDDHFGRYCTAKAGSNPTCTDGPACCEAAPATDPSGAMPVALTDDELAAWDPDHTQGCEVGEIDGGKMDRYVVGTPCSSPHNFALATDLVKPLWDEATSGALADRYFQPIAGQSSSNDMYLARAGYVFTDNAYGPGGVTGKCSLETKVMQFPGPTIADLLVAHGSSWAWYGEGYQAMVDSITNDGLCPDPPDECGAHEPFYPCNYDPTDVPFQYYASLRDNATYMKDYLALAVDLVAGTLPQVSFVKAIGYRSEHPGYHTRLSDGVTFVKTTVDAILASQYGASTLVLVTYDEGGGYFDHVAPPAASTVDMQPYGTRIPLLALGPFAKKGHVSHVQMEHSSLVKFIEWNWLDGETGQLGARDATVNGIGDLLDPQATGTPVPQ